MVSRSKLLIFCAFLACASVLSCQKQGAKLLSGSYTYKISGTVGLVPTITEGTILEDTTYMNLATEQGQMNIAPYGSSDRIIISWNDIAGDVCSTTATVNGSAVKLDTAGKTASVRDGLLSYEGNITYSGEGALYDNMLIIPLEYSGKFTVGGISMKVVSSDIKCIAKANE